MTSDFTLAQSRHEHRACRSVLAVFQTCDATNPELAIDAHKNSEQSIDLVFVVAASESGRLAHSLTHSLTPLSQAQRRRGSDSTAHNDARRTRNQHDRSSNNESEQQLKPCTEGMVVSRNHGTVLARQSSLSLVHLINSNSEVETSRTTVRCQENAMNLAPRHTMYLQTLTNPPSYDMTGPVMTE